MELQCKWENHIFTWEQYCEAVIIFDIGDKFAMMHLFTKLVNFAISKNSSTKIQTLEHIQRRIEWVSLDIKNICVCSLST